jgi:hypothetical protein
MSRALRYVQEAAGVLENEKEYTFWFLADEVLPTSRIVIRRPLAVCLVGAHFFFLVKEDHQKLLGRLNTPRIQPVQPIPQHL